MTKNKKIAAALVIANVVLFAGTSFVAAENGQSKSGQQFFKAPELTINPSGNFLVHGMTVQSISGDSFTGTVWGTTWTVNVTTSTSEFYLRGDKKDRGTIDLSQIQVGDEVGVTGKVDPNHPLTVVGNVVRNYTTVTPRPNKGDHNGTSTKEMENGSSTHEIKNGSTTKEMQDKLQGLLKQMEELKGKFHSQNGGN
jgi:hypothetical protein